MKTLKFIVAAVFAVALGTTLYAQNSKTATTKTESVKVMGNCEMCKARIEKAAKVDGVSKAEWNADTKMLTLTYNPSKVNSNEVQKKIAAVGYDTEKAKATDADYKKLPKCCQYR